MGQEDEIRLIAHSLWKNEGCPEGRDLEHWLTAEIIWNEQQRRLAQADASEPPDRAKKRQRRSALKTSPRPMASKTTKRKNENLKD